MHSTVSCTYRNVVYITGVECGMKKDVGKFEKKILLCCWYMYLYRLLLATITAGASEAAPDVRHSRKRSSSHSTGLIVYFRFTL